MSPEIRSGLAGEETTVLHRNAEKRETQNAALGGRNSPHGRLRADGRRPEGTVAGVGIRPSVEADAATIKSMVRAESVNPRNLHWPRFLVAEVGGRIVGVQQVRVHNGGTREVASRVVLPEFRRRGIGTELLRAALAQDHGTLYLQCNEKWTRYYERFGFRRVRPSELPADLRGQYRIARIIVAVRSLFVRRKLSVIPMKRDA